MTFCQEIIKLLGHVIVNKFTCCQYGGRHYVELLSRVSQHMVSYIIYAKLNKTKGLIWELWRSSESLSTSKSARHSRVGQAFFYLIQLKKKVILMILAGCRLDFQPILEVRFCHPVVG